MKHLDDSLIVWGIDFTYLCNGMYKQNEYAIIHSVKCINPFQKYKNQTDNSRELSLTKNWDQEYKYGTIIKKIGCPTRFDSKNIKYNDNRTYK